jgi:uncharacterized protein (TIGR03000 family)
MLRGVVSVVGALALAATAILAAGPGASAAPPFPPGGHTGRPPFVPGAPYAGYRNFGGYHNFPGYRPGVWPGASFYPYRPAYYGSPYYGYGPRFPYGYAGNRFALSFGVGSPWLYRRGLYGSYASPVAVAVPYYLPYYVPVPTAPELPPVDVGPLNPAPEPAPLPVESFGTARITVQVPAGAKLWVDGKPTTQTGAVREFVTPPSLDLRRTYQYTLRAQWEENGQPVTRERTVEFKSGSAVIVNFNVDVANPS